mmetsp:Transcript_1024/g.2987  ORF Transcript_1024/g.2987 Transcript_1024/m.2987 type:complete len:339 (-) Transcript_1024:483-1499(-)|eukprot:CAMPEP_0198119726 /NCGR_PEP_ID=MMETSP1442-20131203/26803_1 /TAXON_ID= /ORGANISM="Craspedostauros australis, Strain CCMP3328" /LENGTH=338 /DNA_ID=CAMNT_0043778255 /DNA_START=37 /DNA_END=1053 /DNA_ORIENTATION=+
MEPVTIISLNTYLIARYFNKGRITRPDGRASMIRALVERKKPNLALFQEVWGSGLSNLVAGMEAPSHSASSQHVKDDDGHRWQVPAHRSVLLPIAGAISEIVHTMRFRWLQTGGLYDLHDRHTSACLYRDKHTFTVSRSRSKKGVEATLWKFAAWGGDRQLLVLNTHLDPWHVLNRRRQVQEIKMFLDDTLGRLEHRGYDMAQTGVLVVGDFNVKAGSNEYDDLFAGDEGDNRKWVDLFASDQRKSSGVENEPNENGMARLVGAESAKHGTDDHTYCIRNSLVSYPKDCGRIDYAFTLERFERHRLLALDCVHAEIERQQRGEELSDHYPLIFQLIPR